MVERQVEPPAQLPAHVCPCPLAIHAAHPAGAQRRAQLVVFELVQALCRDDGVVALDLGELPSEARPQKPVGAVRRQPQQLTKRHDLHAIEVLESQLVREEGGETDQLGVVDRLARAHAPHETIKLVCRGGRCRAAAPRLDLRRHLRDRVLQEARDLDLDLHALLDLLFLAQLVLERRGEHVGEDAEEQGERELHKGNEHDDKQRDEAEDVGGGAGQLSALAAREGFAARSFERQPGGDAHLDGQQLGADPVVVRLLAHDFFRAAPPGGPVGA